MKKILFISFVALFTSIYAKAQISSYSSYDNEVSVVYEVEDMESFEIKDYNSWTKAGIKHKASLMYINAYRAQINLINAPATIIDFHLYNDEENSGAAEVLIEIINSTPKTIKEITLEFEFENNGTPVYDIKTGDRYMVLKYSNLSGRTKSDLYVEVADKIMNCYHHFQTKDATYKKLFYNKKANIVRLHSAKIKYSDGSTSTKIAVFDNGYNGKQSLFNDGPLYPIVKYLKHLEEKEAENNRIQEQKMKKEEEDKKQAEEKQRRETMESLGIPFTLSNGRYKEKEKIDPPTYNDNEVFKSIAHMPSFPGGDAALMKHINANMIYPNQAKLDNKQGKVIVQFVVKKDGSIGDVKVVRGLDKELDAEAIRICKTITGFEPGRNAVGNPVNVWYTLPITFKLP